jgi:hypothetical protein
MIALAVVAAQYAGTFDASVSARGDGRINAPATVVSVEGKQEKVVAAADASFSASAFVHVRDRHWDFSVAYSPSIVVPDLELQVDRDVNPSVDPTVLNGASASLRWHDRYSWFSVTESGAYGQISTTVPYAGAPTITTPQQQTSGTMQTPSQTTTPPGMTTTLLPGMTGTPTQAATQTTLFSQRDVQYAASSTGVAAGMTFGRRTTATLAGSYTLSGGLDADTHILPYQSGPTGALSIATRISRSEAVFTTVSGDYAYMDGECPLYLLPLYPNSPRAVAEMQTPIPYQLPCTTKTYTAQLVEGYTRMLGRQSTVFATVGVAAANGPVQNGGESLGIVPVFSLGYTEGLYTFWPGSLSVTLGVGPTVDLLTSIISDEATLVAALNARVTKTVTVAFSVGGVQSIPIPANDSPVTSVSAGIEAHVRVNRQIDVNGGVQGYWQEQVYGGGAGLPAQSFLTFTPIADVGVTVRAPTLHF